jgi:hypothetical protein
MPTPAEHKSTCIPTVISRKSQQSSCCVVLDLPQEACAQLWPGASVVANSDAFMLTSTVLLSNLLLGRSDTCDRSGRRSRHSRRPKGMSGPVEQLYNAAKCRRRTIEACSNRRSCNL